MFTIHLRAGDLKAGWRTTPAGFQCGRSRVEPLRHRALEELAMRCGARLAVCVRERGAGLPGVPLELHTRPGSVADVEEASFERLQRELCEWPLLWQLLVVDGSARSSVPLATLRSSAWGTAPTFLIADGDELHGDWDAARLLPHLRRTSLDPTRAARYLSDYATPYGRDTLMHGLQLLTERAVASWRSQSGEARLSIDYPPPWRRPLAGTLRPGVDPVATFDAIVSASMCRWTGVADGWVGSELSGGLDSAIVAVAATATVAPLRSYGIELLGPARAGQTDRRAELVARFGLDDVKVAIDSLLPLAPGSCRLEGGAPVLPWEEGYYEATDALLQAARADGTAVMFTGFGGDELCGLRPSELAARRAARGEPPRPRVSQRDDGPAYLTSDARATLSEVLDDPPSAACSESSIECAAFSAARYLRRGIWPIHPLCTPELVHFCARLPPQWRARRALARETLCRRGCSPHVTHPRQQDDFSYALERSLRGPARPLLERLFEDPVLAELGIVDAERLRRSFASWCDEHGERDDAVRYFAPAVTELFLAQMT